MLMTSFSDLLQAKKALDDMQAQKPALFHRFINVIQLTRQLQYRFQYMGSLIMEEDTSKYEPSHQHDYVLSVYQKEVSKLKEDQNAQALQELFTNYKKLGYANISRLALGTNPRILVGPVVVR